MTGGLPVTAPGAGALRIEAVANLKTDAIFVHAAQFRPGEYIVPLSLAYQAILRKKPDFLSTHRVPATILSP